MSQSDWTQCPFCGWTGRTSKVEINLDGQSCPACGEMMAIE